MHHMKTRRSKRFGDDGESRKKILLVAPKHPESFWSMQGMVDMLGKRTLMPNSALATLVALTPGGVNVEYFLMDENVSEIDLDFECDLVAITGSTLHTTRVRDLVSEFRQRGKLVALGGAYATLEADRCEGLADFHFIGEAEHTWPKFLEEWQRGEADEVYTQESFIDLGDSPAPDWSLVDEGDYLNFPVQTSRGCPNGCEFCDVIQYVGRKYRTKSADQILEEISGAQAAGAQRVFFSDDNFLGNKRFTMELLRRLLQWNRVQEKPLSFSTQITVKVGDDDELLKLMADVRFSVLFLGVETVRKACLEEINKPINLSNDMHERIRRITRYGIVPFIGLIVGFDNDDATVFDDLRDFLDETGSPIVGISLLNAPRHTPLHERLKKEGRLREDGFSGEWQLNTNIIPKQMSREELFTRYWSFFKECYDPVVFERRLHSWMAQVEYFAVPYEGKSADLWEALKGIKVFWRLMTKDGKDVRKLFLRCMKKTWKGTPRLMGWLFVILIQYSHFYSFVNKDRGHA